MAQDKNKAPPRKKTPVKAKTPEKAKTPVKRKPVDKPTNSYSAERRLCDTWLDNKNTNPETGKKIKTDGPVYNKYARMCVSFKVPIKPNTYSAGTPVKRKPVNKPTNTYSAERRLCDTWLENKTKNPETGKTIQKGKGIYNKYERMCVSFKEPIKPSKDSNKEKVTEKEMCKRWLTDKNTNPMTGRKIKTDGPVYTKLSKQCSRI